MVKVRALIRVRARAWLGTGQAVAKARTKSLARPRTNARDRPIYLTIHDLITMM